MFNRRQFLVGSGAAWASLALLGNQAFAQRLPSITEVQYDPDIPVLGNPLGDVTIVEYFDYQCTYCRTGHADLMRVVQDDGNIRLILKDWIIFGETSAYASRLVLATENLGDYEKAVEALMKATGQLNRDRVKELLAQAGLDPEKLETRFRDNATHINNILSRNMDQAEAFNFVGTPAFIVGTKVYGGVMRHADLVQAVREARKA